jgi:hypothetical protein
LILVYMLILLHEMDGRNVHDRSTIQRFCVK